MDIGKALARCGGAARTRELKALGIGDSVIRRAIAAGRVVSPSRGIVALPSARPDAVVAASLGAQLTCVSALAHLGLPLRSEPASAHLAVHRSFAPRGRASRDARLHYQQLPLTRPRPVSAAQALDVAGACIDEIWHLCAVDAALNRGLITLGDVLDFRKTSAARKEFLLRFADGRSQAPGESIVRQRLVVAGHKVRPQAYVEGAGLVDIEVDAVLLLEVDGYGPHSGKAAFRKDRERGRAFVKAGRPALTYAAAEVLGAWTPDVVKDVREAIAAWRSQDGTR